MSKPDRSFSLAGDSVRDSSRERARLTSDLRPLTSVVVARGLTKIYNQRWAVDAIDFSVQRGETFGLLGPNGAGKSTTMRMIACRAPLTSGELLVEELDVQTQGREIRSLIGVVPQENNLDPDLNVRRNLIVYASYYRIPKVQAAKRADEQTVPPAVAARCSDFSQSRRLGVAQRRILQIQRS